MLHDLAAKEKENYYANRPIDLVFGIVSLFLTLAKMIYIVYLMILGRFKKGIFVNSLLILLAVDTVFGMLLVADLLMEFQIA